MTEDDRAQAYRELPPHVRHFLEDLRPEDVASIVEGIALAKAARTMAKFWKWVWLLIVGAFMGAMSIGQSYDWLMRKWHGGP